MIAPTADVQEESATIPFMVLQCKGCRTIVGDTGSLLNLQKENLIMTLTKMSANVLIDKELETSKEGSDYGSTFNNMFCKNCNEWLGRCYRTTTPDLDELRGNYTFSIGQLIMFEMDAPFPDAVQVNHSRAKMGADAIEITKLQKFVVALYDRLEQLELENDNIREELRALASRPQVVYDHPADVSFTSTKSKNRNKRNTKPAEEANGEEQAKVVQKRKVNDHPTEQHFTAIQSCAASLLEQPRKLDTKGAMEAVSWSILMSSDPAAVIQAIAQAQ